MINFIRFFSHSIKYIYFIADYTEACEYRDRRRHMYPPIYNERLILQRPIPIVDVVQENAVIFKVDDDIDGRMGATNVTNERIAELIGPNINQLVDDETVHVVKTEKVIYGSALVELEQFLNNENSLTDSNETTPQSELSDENGCDPPNEVIESVIVINMPIISSNDDNIYIDAASNPEAHVLLDAAATAEVNVSNEFGKVEGSLSNEDSLIAPNETADSQSELGDQNECDKNDTADCQSESCDENGGDLMNLEPIATSAPAHESIPSLLQPNIVDNRPAISSNDDDIDFVAPPSSEAHVLLETAATAQESVSHGIGSISINNFPEVGSTGANIESPPNVEAAVLGGDVAIETVVTIDDDITMTFTGTQIGRPIQSISIPSDFVKREADRISGEIPYKEDKVGISIL